MQSSAALLERQRNPGVGYFAQRGESTNGSMTPGSPAASTATLSRTASPAPSAAGSANNDEEVNLEYLRNVILQFLEHKEMRVRCSSGLKGLARADELLSRTLSAFYRSFYASRRRRHGGSWQRSDLRIISRVASVQGHADTCSNLYHLFITCI